MTKNKQLQQQDITTQCVTRNAAKSAMKGAEWNSQQTIALNLKIARSTVVIIFAVYVNVPVTNILMSELNTKWYKLRRLHIKILRTKSIKRKPKVLLINKS